MEWRGQAVRGDEFSMGHVDFEVPLEQAGRYVHFDMKEFTLSMCRVRSYKGWVGTLST